MEKAKNVAIIGKKELVKTVAVETDTVGMIGKVTKCVDAVFDAIQDAVSKGDKVQIVGFGTFKTVDIAERKGRNPRTGEEITIPAHKRIVFSPGQKFKNSLDSVE